MKSETIIGRIRAIKEDCKMNESQFAEKIGKTQQAINKMFADENKDIMVSTIVGILNAFPEISIDWLVMGKGGMKKEEGSSIEEAKSRISELERERDLQYKYISTLEHRIAELEGAGASEKKKAV